MAKIDGVGRMLLPPDPGIKSQAYSARERATSEPVVRALTEWFKTIQHNRRGDTDQALLQAVRNVLTDSARAGDPVPRAITGQITAAIPYHEVKGGRLDQLYYQVTIGQSAVVVNSKAPLEIGQALILTQGKDKPHLLVPQTPSQSRLILALAQQLQVINLPTPQNTTPLPLNNNALFSRLLSTVNTAAPAPQSAPHPSAAPVPGITASTGEMLSPLLSKVLSQWLSALPGTGRPMTAEASSSLAPARAAPGQALALSNHWIPQLIQAARAEHGSATAHTVRQIWQQWQTSIRDQLVPVVQGASSDRTRASPTTAMASTTGRPSAPASTAPVFIQAMTPSTAQNALPLPLQTGAIGTADPVSTLLSQLAGLLKGASEPTPGQPATAETPTAPRTSASQVPTDVWRVLAEQLVDTRLQQLGQPAPPNLQALLHGRAEVLRAQQMTYSPQQLKQLLQPPTGNLAPPLPTQTPEQQSLQQVRQLLEQVTQQQQARTVAPGSAEPGSEAPRQVQGLPVMHDQHLVWFDLERQPTPEEPAGQKPSERRWVLDLHFHLSPMAPICARLRWQGSYGEIEFLTDDMPTLRALHAQAPDLQVQLKQQGLPIEDIHCRHGLPKRTHTQTRNSAAAPDSGGQIDVHT